MVKRQNALSAEEVAKRPKILPETKIFDGKFVKNEKWTNRQRVLYIKSRGLSYKGKQLMKDLVRLSPHSKVESTLDMKGELSIINEIAESRNCSKIVHFEARKNTDLYMWMSNTTDGPCIKFLIKNFETSENFKFSGNCLKSSRPLLSFSDDFDNRSEYRFIREMCVRVFSVPNFHPNSQPFNDRIYSFSIVNGSVAFRHYQIVDHKTQELTEIGPRMLLEPIKIFDGSLGGKPLYANEDYVTPNQIRAEQRKQKELEKTQIKAPKVHKKAQLEELPRDVIDDVFA